MLRTIDVTEGSAAALSTVERTSSRLVAPSITRSNSSVVGRSGPVIEIVATPSATLMIDCGASLCGRVNSLPAAISMAKPMMPSIASGAMAHGSCVKMRSRAFTRCVGCQFPITSQAQSALRPAGWQLPMRTASGAGCRISWRVLEGERCRGRGVRLPPRSPCPARQSDRRGS